MLVLPPHFMTVRYDPARFPGAEGVRGVDGGANCQQFAYTVLRYFGYEIDDFRSSELWSDRTYTASVRPPFRPLDLLLWHRHADAWGAHVGIYVGRRDGVSAGGDEYAVHLAQAVGVPVIWSLSSFIVRPEYRCFIGAKRPLRRR